jgi:hypothetical protein
MGGSLEPVAPARWDVPRGDRLGSLPLRPEPADPRAPQWRGYDYRRQIVETAGRVPARSGGGDLYFPGRSCDSLRDVLAVFLAGTSHAGRVRLLPFSVDHIEDITPAALRQWRVNTAAFGLEPAVLARSRTPVTLCDLVWRARTFGFFYRALRGWAQDTGEPWSVIRRKLRFLGLVDQRETSPHTWRWSQDEYSSWVRELPSGAVHSIPLPYPVWSYLGDHQGKLSASFTHRLWHDPEQAALRDRGEATRRALHEAQRLVDFARSAEGRELFVRRLVADRAMREPWLRALVGALRGTDSGRRTRRVNASRLASAARR